MYLHRPLFVAIFLMLSVVFFLYTTTWHFAPVGADTLSLLMDFRNATGPTEVLVSPLLSSNADFGAGPYWRPLTNLFFWYAGYASNTLEPQNLYFLGFSVHCAISFFGAVLISHIFPETNKFVLAALVFLHPIAADVLPSISRYQDMFGVFFTFSAGFVIVSLDRPWLALALASLAPFFKELYIFAPIAVSATVFFYDIISRQKVRYGFVTASMILAICPIFLRLSLNIDLPDGAHEFQGLSSMVKSLVKIMIALLIPLYSVYVSAALGMALITLLAAQRRKLGVDFTLSLESSGLLSVLFLTFTFIGVVSILVLSYSFSLRSCYVLVIPAVSLLVYIFNAVRESPMFRSAFILFLISSFSASSIVSILDWHLCDDVWQRLFVFLEDTSSGELEILRSDVFFPWDRFFSNPSCIMSYTLTPLEIVQTNVKVSSGHFGSFPVSSVLVMRDADLQVVYFTDGVHSLPRTNLGGQDQ